MHTQYENVQYALHTWTSWGEKEKNVIMFHFMIPSYFESSRNRPVVTYTTDGDSRVCKLWLRKFVVFSARGENI